MTLAFLTRILTATLLSLGALWGVVSPAQAHSDRFQSIPAQGSTVSVVNKLQFTFVEAVQKNIAPEVVLTGEMGVTFPLGTPTFDASGATMTVPITIGALPNGKFAAVYRIVSVDGHIATGVVNFTVAGSTATAVPVAPTGSASSIPAFTAPGQAAKEAEINAGVMVAVGVGALLALAAATALVLVAIRRRR